MAISNLAKAQQFMKGTITNNSGCDVIIEFYDSGPALIYSHFAGNNNAAPTTTGCQGGGTLGVVVTVKLKYQNCNGGAGISISVNGSDNFVATSCGGTCSPVTGPGTACATLVSSSSAGSGCGGLGTVTDVAVTIN